MYLNTSTSSALGLGSPRTTSRSLSIYTSSLLRRGLWPVTDDRLALGLPVEPSSTLTISTRGGGLGAAAGGAGQMAGSSLGGVTVFINGGKDDRCGADTYSTEGCRSQVTVSEIRVSVV